MVAEIGVRAPDFELRDQNYQTRTLADLAGSKAMVVFIPWAFTRTCQSELCTLPRQPLIVGGTWRQVGRHHLRQRRLQPAVGQRSGVHRSRSSPTIGPTELPRSPMAASTLL